MRSLSNEREVISSIERLFAPPFGQTEAAASNPLHGSTLAAFCPPWSGDRSASLLRLWTKIPREPHQAGVGCRFDISSNVVWKRKVLPAALAVNFLPADRLIEAAAASSAIFCA